MSEIGTSNRFRSIPPSSSIARGSRRICDAEPARRRPGSPGARVRGLRCGREGAPHSFDRHRRRPERRAAAHAGSWTPPGAGACWRAARGCTFRSRATRSLRSGGASRSWTSTRSVRRNSAPASVSRRVGSRRCTSLSRLLDLVHPAARRRDECGVSTRRHGGFRDRSFVAGGLSGPSCEGTAAVASLLVERQPIGSSGATPARLRRPVVFRFADRWG